MLPKHFYFDQKTIVAATSQLNNHGYQQHQNYQQRGGGVMQLVVHLSKYTKSSI